MEMQEGKLAQAAYADCSLDTKTLGATVPGSVTKGNLRSSSCLLCSKAGAEGAWRSPAVLGEAVLMEQRLAQMNHSPGLRVWAAMVGGAACCLGTASVRGLNNSTAPQRVLQHCSTACAHIAPCPPAPRCPGCAQCPQAAPRIYFRRLPAFALLFCLFVFCTCRLILICL